MQNANGQYENEVQGGGLSRKPAAYDFVVATIRNFGTCVKHKTIVMTFEDELDEDTLSKCLDLALELGDLVKPTLGCVSAPEFAEHAHPAGVDEDDVEEIPF
jgi:hypothetical protein